MSWLIYFVAVCLALLAADLLVHLVYGYLALPRFEARPPFRVPPPPHDAQIPETVRIPTGPGGDLELEGGVYLPQDENPRGLIVFCPETEGSYLTAMNYTPALVEAGFAVLSFSFRNQEPSDSQPGYRAMHWFTEHEVEDLHAVLNFVEQMPQFSGLPIGLFGVSRGAGVALAGGASRPEVAAIWSQGAFPTHGLVVHFSMKWIEAVTGYWGRFIPRWHVAVTTWFTMRMSEWRNGGRFVRLEPNMAKWQGRYAMFVCGARDNYVPSRFAQDLCRRSRRSLDEGLWVVPHAKHNLEREAAREDYDRRVVQFFEQIVPARTVPQPREQAFAG